MLGLPLELHCIFTNGLFWILFRESGIATWHQASTSPHDLFSPGASTLAKTAYSTMSSPNLSWRQTSAALHDHVMPSKPVPSGRFLPIIKFDFWHRMQPLPLRTASVHWPEEIRPRKFHFNGTGVFLITANLSALATQHQLYQQSKSFTLLVLPLLILADS